MHHKACSTRQIWQMSARVYLCALLAAGRASSGSLPAEPGCGVPLTPYNFTRCSCNPIASAGYLHHDTGLYEVSLGDPDVTYHKPENTWRAYWSTGLATSYFANNSLVIKAATSADGYSWMVQVEPALLNASSVNAWDATNCETPSVVRMPPGGPPDRRFLMLYSGGNLFRKAGPRGYTWYQVRVQALLRRTC